MMMLGFELIGTLHKARPHHPGGNAHSLQRPLTLQFDNYEPSQFKLLASAFGQNQYGYVVTPNADHIIRLRDDPAFVELYDRADFILLDSRFLARILRWTRNLKLPVCTGSDLTASLLSDVVHADDRLVVIGGSQAQVRFLSVRYQLRAIAHHNPPMGFIRDPQAVEECLAFIELHSPFRFCLLAVGSPQQEILARRLQERGTARGLALCVGASLDFLTGADRVVVSAAPGTTPDGQALSDSRPEGILGPASGAHRAAHEHRLRVDRLSLHPRQPSLEVAAPEEQQSCAQAFLQG